VQRQVLITGGTSGIGQAIAEAFYRDGCGVTVTGLTTQEVQEPSRSTGEIQALQLDVTEVAQVMALVNRFDRLDVLVNAAGTILRDGQEFEPDHFSRVVDVNLTGAMRMCAAAKEKLFATRGCVINIASMLSFFGSGYAPAYSASKGGIVQLTRSLAIAWAPHGVRVNAIAPGWIETGLTQPLWTDPERRQAIISRTPLGRWGKPEDLAGAALFLASPAATFITGAVLPVDGGYSVA
jgi:2-dehydro-3-deoxy-D-gluconate 5-dehydrogenase